MVNHFADYVNSLLHTAHLYNHRNPIHHDCIWGYQRAAIKGGVYVNWSIRRGRETESLLMRDIDSLVFKSWSDISSQYDYISASW
jgi:hypothetical protein